MRNSGLEIELMNVREVNLDISLPDDMMIDLWLVQWHTPTPNSFQPIAEPYRSEKASIIGQLTKLLRESARTTPADRLAMVVFPEISLPKDQRGAIEELLTIRDRPTIVVASFEHLAWADYETLLAEMPNTPQPEICDAERQAGTFVNVAGIWIRDRSGNVNRYLQPKLHPSGSEQPAVFEGQNVLVFKSNDQASRRRLNFCVQICSDFCSRTFVEELRQAIDKRIPGHQLDMLILPQHHDKRKANQFPEAFDTYFDPGVAGVQTDDGCIIRVNNSAPNHGKSEMYGDSGLCFPHGRWRVKNPPATYWMQLRKNHQAITVREGGPGVYRFAYKPHCWISRRPGSGQETPFPDNAPLFAPIDKDVQGNAVILRPFSIWAEAHWLVNEWQADREAYQRDLEENTTLLPEGPSICDTCGDAHKESFLQWKDHIGVNPEITKWMLHSYLSCWSSEPAFPPDQPEPNEWPDVCSQAVGKFLRCYSLVSLGTNGAIQPYIERNGNLHARLENNVDLFFFWGGSRWAAQTMITRFKSRLSPSGLIKRQMLLVLIDPSGTTANDSLRDILTLRNDVTESRIATNGPDHLSQGGTVINAQRCSSINLINNDQLLGQVHSATSEVDLVQGLETILSEELAASD